MEKIVDIRKSTESDKEEIARVHLEAFGDVQGPVIADLVKDMMNDRTALPILSLVAMEESRIVGHVLFTKADVVGSGESVSGSILAPLAVRPGSQSKGVGGGLIGEGLRQLKQSGVELVFVLGHPGYYPRSGFVPAGALGFEAPYPIPPEHADAWMVQELTTGVLGRVQGKVRCSLVLNQPQHWRE